MDKVLITGGAGSIGSLLAERLVEGGLSVRILDNPWRGNARNLRCIGRKVQLMDGDLRDRNAFKSAVASRPMDPWNSSHDIIPNFASSAKLDATARLTQ